jgi:hypothetical protein
MGLNNAASALSRVLGPQAAGLVFSGINANGPFFLGAAIVAPAALLALVAGRATAAREANEARASREAIA